LYAIKKVPREQKEILCYSHLQYYLWWFIFGCSSA